MMVYESSALILLEAGVCFPVKAAHEEHFEDILFDEEQDDEDDGKNEHTEGGESGEWR